MVGVSAALNLPLHHKVHKFSSGTGSPGWSQKKGCKMVVVAHTTACELQHSFCRIQHSTVQENMIIYSYINKIQRFGLFSWEVTCHFLFAVHSNYVPILYHFQDRGRYWSKFTDFSRSQFANFPHFTCIWCLLVWHHVDFTKIFSARNTTVSSVPCSLDCLMISAAICNTKNTSVWWTDRQIDGTEFVHQYCALHSSARLMCNENDRMSSLLHNSATEHTLCGSPIMLNWLSSHA